MNIFVLDMDPVVAASMHCDKHVVKMALESVQILCTVAHLNGLKAPYRPTHVKHPCVKWAGETYENWSWLIVHSNALHDEYARRYWRTHGSYYALEWCEDHDAVVRRMIVKAQDRLTAMPQCMPEEYRRPDVVGAYRAYYIGDKSRFARWKHSRSPDWWPYQEQ